MTTAARGTWLRAAVLVLLLAAGTGAALAVGLPSVATVRSWADGAGVATLVLAVGLALLAPVPRSAVSVLVGVVAGFATGVAVALLGGLLAALAAFGLARWLGRAAALRLAGPRVARVDGLLAGRGFLAVLTGRLLPVIPFVGLSYAAGLTGVRFAPYGLATALGLVPGTVLQVGVGASVGFVADAATVSLVASLAALAVVVTGAGVVLWRRRRAAVPA
jgi:uncharacterized membrane protein YdjX (TVP38/TMEM64 family)